MFLLNGFSIQLSHERTMAYDGENRRIAADVFKDGFSKLSGLST